ncbi:hypothetical protein BH11MYX1_BH11MYX1_13500 [soil metagenome]
MRYALVALLVTSCVQPRSARCKQVCARESECVTVNSSASPFDEKECVAACAVLEADQDNLAKVQKHADCVLKHPACGDVLDCQ